MSEKNKGGRPPKQEGDITQYCFKISTTADCKRSLGRLMNLCANNKMDIANVRMCTEIIRVAISLQKNVELEERLQEIEDMMNMSREEE